MSVDLILMDDVADLGKLGDRVKVAEGFARNYLLPKKLAVPSTPQNLQRLESKKKVMAAKYAENLAIAKSLAERIAAVSVTIPMQATEDDKLYGSVTPAQILAALKESGIEVERSTVNLPDGIRELGVFNVEIQLHREVTANLKVWVVRQ